MTCEARVTMLPAGQKTCLAPAGQLEPVDWRSGTGGTRHDCVL